MLLQPKILKTDKIIGSNIILRNVTPDDASFIVEARTNEKKSKFISKTSSDVIKQREWLESYSKSEDQAYFIITNKEGSPYGTVRIYDPQGTSFCWGSWVIKDGAPKNCAIESALLIYYYALFLGFENCHFDVRKGNNSVIKFHERFGAIRIGENELDYFFEIKKNKIELSLEKYKKFLPLEIKII